MTGLDNKEWMRIIKKKSNKNEEQWVCYMQ